MIPEKILPIYLGQIMNVKIECTGNKGDGIAKERGMCIIVPKTQEGKSYKVQITSIKRKYAFAEVVE